MSKIHSFEKDDFTDIRFRCNNDHLSEFVTDKVDNNIKFFTSKYSEQFSSVSMDLDLKKHHIRVKGIPEYECRINLRTNLGMFYAKEVCVGAVRAVNGCLSHLEMQIKKKKGKFESRVPTRNKDPYMISEFEEC